MSEIFKPLQSSRLDCIKFKNTFKLQVYYSFIKSTAMRLKLLWPYKLLQLISDSCARSNPPDSRYELRVAEKQPMRIREEIKLARGYAQHIPESSLLSVS